MTEAEQQRSSEAANAAQREETSTHQMLVRKYASVVLGLCMARTKNFHDSEDIMQEVFLKAFEKFGTLRDQSRVLPWLLKIASRMCIDYRRKLRPCRSISEDMPARPDYGNQHITRIHEAISELGEGHREPITLYYLDGRNCASVARTLGISEDAVRQRLVRARLRLHEILSEDKS